MGSPVGRDPRGSGRLGAFGRVVCRSSRIPPPRVAVPSGGGGASPRLRGGKGSLLWPSSWGGERGGAGWGGRSAAPRPPRPRRASACHQFSPARPPGVYSCRGACRAAVGVGRGPVGRQWVSAALGGGRGRGAPPPWFAPPPSTGRPLKGALRFRCPGRRWSPVSQQREGRERAGGSPGALAAAGVPPQPGCGGLFGGVPGCRLFGLPLSALGPEGEGGGSGGGPLVPWRRALTAQGGRPGGPSPGGQPSAGGSHSSPAPLYPEPEPRAGPRLVPLSPPPSPRGARRPGAAVRVSGQRLAGCGAVGSPPRSLSLPSLPREVARAPPSRRIVRGAWVGGPDLPPTLSRLPSGPSPAPPHVWGLRLWRWQVAPAVAPVGEGAAQGPGDPVVGVCICYAEHRPPFQEGRPRRPPIRPRRPDH